MQERPRQTWLTADFFTHNHRISGRVNIRHQKLADQLNSQATAFLQLEETYVSNIDHPATITASHTTSILRKGGIAAVVVTQEEDGLPIEHTYGSYFGVYLRKVFLTVPSFEIEGYLRLSGKMDLRTVLTTGTDQFILILDGEMCSTLRPEIKFSGGTILINKAHIEAFSVIEEEE